MKRQGNKGKTVVFALTERGLPLAEKIARSFGTVDVFEPRALVSGGLKKEAARAFRDAGALVFISAAGIAVRCVAPLLKGKHTDPAVVVVDERGKFAISLLSGHMGGANALAEKVAKALRAVPVITTATDIWGLPSVEDLAKRFSLVIEDPKKIKAVNSAILAHEKVFVVDNSPKRRAEVTKMFKGVFTCSKTFPESLGLKEACVLVSSALETIPSSCVQRTLVLRPRDIVIGVGCGKGVSKGLLKKALIEAFAQAGLSALSVKNFATIDIKKNEKGLKALAMELDAPIETYGAKELNKVKCPSKPSSAVMKATGAYAVAEPAALISSGAKRLCLKKTKIGHVTIAAAFLPSR